MSFPERLKEASKLRITTQKQVAESIHVTETQYQKYEHGKVKPAYDVIIKLCTYFNVSADYLLGLPDDPHPIHRKDDSCEQ